MTSRDRVRFGDQFIEYEIRRSGRRKKTVQITLDGGRVRVTAPVGTPARELKEIVLKKAAWIVGRLAEPKPEAAPPRLVSGETLPYLGRNVPMIVESGGVGSPTVRYENESLMVSAPPGVAGSDSGDRVRHAIVQWYRSRAAERLSAEVDRWWPRFGRGEKQRIIIGDQRRRWGSCAADGTLRFNWRLMMLEPSLIDLVVVHELAHLTVQNHSAEFWDLVSQGIPDLKDRRRLMREAGKTLPL